MQFLILPVLLILMYMLLLRPQQQRVRRQQQLISTIGVGDRVVTAGGLIGRVVELDDEHVWLEVADDVVIELLRMYVIRRLDDEPTVDEVADIDVGDEDVAGAEEDAAPAPPSADGDHPPQPAEPDPAAAAAPPVGPTDAT